MQTPLIITVFSNQEVIYLLLSATHSLKVSEELAGTLEAAPTGRCKTFLLSPLVSLPLCSFLLLLLLFADSLTPLARLPPPQPQPPTTPSGVLRLAAVGPQTRFHRVDLASP